MKIPVVGGSMPDDVELNNQRTINYYIEIDKKAEHQSALISTPGADPWTKVGTGPIRKKIRFNDNLIVMSGSQIYKVSEGGNPTAIGSISSSDGAVSMSHNGSEVFIVDDVEGTGYIYNGSKLSQISDLDFTDKKHIGSIFHDGYFVTGDQGTGQFRISATYDGTAWEALDFATSESKPDDLVGIVSAKNMLWMFGTETMEVYQNTGNADFPFESVRSVFSHFGAVKNSMQQMDNNVYWIAENLQGGIGVLRLDSAVSPSQVSSTSINNFLSGLSQVDLNSVISNTLIWKGHSWLVYTFPFADTFGRTLVYDSSVDEWFEWSTGSESGDNIGAHIGVTHNYFAGHHVVGSDDGWLYRLKDDVFTDNDIPIVRERHLTVVRLDGNKIKYKSFELDIQTGTGTPGTEYFYELTYSNDGGKTYGNSRSKSIGSGGEYNRHVEWWRLGQSENRAFKIISSAACQHKIRGAYLRVSGIYTRTKKK